MTFEEKFSFQGKKLDEVKEKIEETRIMVDNAVNNGKLQRQKEHEQFEADLAKLDAELDARFEKLEATVDEKVNQGLDAFDAKAKKQAEEVKAALDHAEVTVDRNAAKARSAIERFAAPLDKSTAESIANEPTRIEKVQNITQDRVALFMGHVNAADENVRLVNEHRYSKRNAVMLQAQMNVENAKAKIEERKENYDKSIQEGYIQDLLEYANSCAEMAESWAYEAEFALMEAAYEVNDYIERYYKD